MKTRAHDSTPIIALMVMLLLVAAAVLCACGPVTPDAPVANEIGFGDDGIQDAGVKGQVVDVKTGVHEILISEADREKFNAYVVIYGKQFTPALTRDIGLTPYKGEYAVRNDIMADFVILNDYAKGFQPPTIPSAK